MARIMAKKKEEEEEGLREEGQELKVEERRKMSDFEAYLDTSQCRYILPLPLDSSTFFIVQTAWPNLHRHHLLASIIL